MHFAKQEPVTMADSHEAYPPQTTALDTRPEEACPHGCSDDERERCLGCDPRDAALSSPARDTVRDTVREAVADAIETADIGYSIRLTRLVDDESTYTATVEGQEPREFEDQDEAREWVATFRRLAKADAVLALPVLRTGSQDASAEPVAHPDDVLADRFAAALKQSFARTRAKGKSGWADPNWMAECQAELLRHVAKGDPLDVAAYAAFCWHHGWSTATPRPPADSAEVAGLRKVNGDLRNLIRDAAKRLFDRRLELKAAEARERDLVADVERLLDILENARLGLVEDANFAVEGPCVTAIDAALKKHGRALARAEQPSRKGSE